MQNLLYSIELFQVVSLHFAENCKAGADFHWKSVLTKQTPTSREHSASVQIESSPFFAIIRFFVGQSDGDDHGDGQENEGE